MTSAQLATRHSVLPHEITDAIIDHLQHDIQALGACSLVCFEWLRRSRHHIFSTIQLWPWRARRLFELAKAKNCTFVDSIGRVEVDNSRMARSTDTMDKGSEEDRNEVMLFGEMMSQSHIPNAAGIRALQIRNVDWTSFTPSQQADLRVGLRRFSHLDRLELHGTVFHDLREIQRILDALPHLLHFTADISFSKYLEYTLESASKTHLARPLVSLELGTADAIATLLTSLTNGNSFVTVRVLRLRNVKQNILQYIEKALQELGGDLQEVVIGLSDDDPSRSSSGDLLRPLDLSPLSKMTKLGLENLVLTEEIIEKCLPSLLEGLESSFLETLGLHFLMGVKENMESTDFRSLERVLLSLHFFGMKTANITVKVQSCASEDITEKEATICRKMSCLRARGALRVEVIGRWVTDGEESNSNKSVPEPTTRGMIIS